MQETLVWSLGWEDPLEKRKAPHSSILAWRIPWTIESMVSQRVGHDWVTFTLSFLTCIVFWWFSSEMTYVFSLCLPYLVMEGISFSHSSIPDFSGKMTSAFSVHIVFSGWRQFVGWIFSFQPILWIWQFHHPIFLPSNSGTAFKTHCSCVCCLPLGGSRGGEQLISLEWSIVLINRWFYLSCLLDSICLICSCFLTGFTIFPMSWSGTVSPLHMSEFTSESLLLCQSCWRVPTKLA